MSGYSPAPGSDCDVAAHQRRFAPPLCILTYHRLIHAEADWKFHDVFMHSFEWQMDRIQNLATRTKPKNALPVIVTFDDGTNDHLQAAEILADRGLTGIFFIITGRMDTSGYLSSRDVRRINDLGHSIGSHTVTHRLLPSLSDAELQIELSRSQQVLAQLIAGKIEWMAPPGGAVDQRSFDAALAAGYSIVRTMDWGYAKNLIGQVPTIPIFKWTTERKFERIVTGRASLMQYRLKRTIRSTLGLNTYVALRNWAARLWRKR